MEYVQMTLSDWMEIKEKIRKDMNNVKHAFVRVGYNLRRIRDGELYRQDGYDNLVDFAREELGLGSSWVSRLISINETYSIDGYSETLLPEYEDYKQSSLIEMLGLPEADRQMITPDTPRENIRELKRFNKEEAGGTDELQQVIEDFCRANKEMVDDLYATDITQETEETLLKIINPSGSRVYKKGLFFISFLDREIKVKKFGQNPQSMSYHEFTERITQIFGPERNPEAWAEKFGESMPVQKTDPIQEVPVSKPDQQTGGSNEESTEESNEKEAPEAEGTASETEDTAAGGDEKAEDAPGGDRPENTGGTDRTDQGQQEGGTVGSTPSAGTGDDPANGSVSGRAEPRPDGSEGNGEDGQEAAGGDEEPPGQQPEQAISEPEQDGQKTVRQEEESRETAKETLTGVDPKNSQSEEEIAPAQFADPIQEIREKIRRALQQLTDDIEHEHWLSAEMRTDQIKTYLRTMREGTNL